MSVEPILIRYRVRPGRLADLTVVGSYGVGE